MDDKPIEGKEYQSRKGDVELFIWRKRLNSTPAPILLLVHGSSLSALPTFDLAVPGKPDYSMMDWFARRGFDVWTCDHEILRTLNAHPKQLQRCFRSGRS